MAEPTSKISRIRYRRSWTGKLILQVAVIKPYNYDPSIDLKPGGYTRTWRDATIEDLTERLP